MRPMLEITVQRRIGDVLIDADLRLPAGVTAITGPSGAGKTSLLNMIAGLARPDRGRIRCDGRTLFDSERRIDLAPERRRIGYVFQDGRLFPHMSVEANLRFGMRFRESEDGWARFEDIVEALGIGALLRRKPRNLSGGEAQRVAIGRTLLCGPSLLLMDEPLSSLDEGRKAGIEKVIEHIRDGLKVPIVFVSHHGEEVRRLADRVVAVERCRPIRHDASGQIAALARSDVANPTSSMRLSN